MDCVPLMDACFSGASLTIVGALLTALTGAIGMLFRHLMTSKNDQIRMLTDERDRLYPIALQAVQAVNQGAEAIKVGRR